MAGDFTWQKTHSILALVDKEKDDEVALLFLLIYWCDFDVEAGEFLLEGAGAHVFAHV